MKPFHIVGVIFLALVLVGCSWWSKPKVEKTADELAAEGQMYFEKEKYIDAVKSYKKLRDWYPFSVHAKEAGLKIADAHYLMKEYDEAILAYSEYERMHPNDSRIPYVIYQIGRCDYDRMETIDRDATPTRNALRTFQRLTEAFPDSEYAQQAAPMVQTCLQNLAAKEMDIALFYFKAKKYKAALNRFATVVTEYPDFGLHPQALDYMARCRARLEEEARRAEMEEAAAATQAAEPEKTPEETSGQEVPGNGIWSPPY